MGILRGVGVLTGTRVGVRVCVRVAVQVRSGLAGLALGIGRAQGAAHTPASSFSPSGTFQFPDSRCSHQPVFPRRAPTCRALSIPGLPDSSLHTCDRCGAFLGLPARPAQVTTRHGRPPNMGRRGRGQAGRMRADGGRCFHRPRSPGAASKRPAAKRAWDILPHGSLGRPPRSAADVGRL